MSPLVKSLVVFVGAGVGGNLRYWLGLWIQDRLGHNFPWSTLVVNATGSLMMGVLVALALREPSGDGWRLLLGVGLLGGYTTYSSFAGETVLLMAEGRWGPALGNLAATNLLCLAACGMGFGLVRMFLGSI